jgi:hypothetical protein
MSAKYQYLLCILLFSCSAKKENKTKIVTDEIVDIIKVADKFLSDSNSIINNYKETDIGDSIVFYKDFDWVGFKGIYRYQKVPAKYPYTKFIYNKGKLVIKAFTSSTISSKLEMNKIQGRWCFHSSHYADGVTSHFFTVIMDGYIISLDFLGNPLTKDEKVLGIKNLYVLRKREDTVQTIFYSQIFEKKPSTTFPLLKKFNDKKFAKDANEVIQIDEYPQGDFLISRTKTIKIDSNNSLNNYKYTQENLLSQSYFYTTINHLWGIEKKSSFLDKVKSVSNLYDSLIR